MPIPTRTEVPASDCWDLSSFFTNYANWESGLRSVDAAIARIETWKGRLGEGPATVLECLQYLTELGMLDERIGYFAFLSMSEDAGDSRRQSMQARYTQVSVKLQTASSYIQPELLALDQGLLDSYLAADILQEYRIMLDKMLRYKPHTLSAAEERILAMQEEANQTASATFRALTDVDLVFGTVETPEGPVNLSQSSFAALQMHPQRTVRENSFHLFYRQFDAHKNTLANLYAGSINLDSFQAKVRHHAGSLESALFQDKVELSVYHQLIATIREYLPFVHRYYALRSRILGLDRLALWDLKVSLVPETHTHFSFDAAVDLVLAALKPLGEEYVETLAQGLRGGWVDRYENQGKRSGAFSAGSFSGWPYILMNYKENVLRDVFTLAHEAGHSMHSWYSARNNPFQHYKYSIFEAEVASTFNEQLLFNYMMSQNPAPEMQAFLINKQLDDILATLVRQTMFAEFELLVHRMAEEGRGLTLDAFRKTYGALQADYFGPSLDLDPSIELEGLRIPHFYRAFYVYKYATGLSAASALALQVTTGQPGALGRYLDFLKSGGSSYPLENLKKAGVDLTTPEPTQAALQQFSHLLDQLEGLLPGKPHPKLA